MNKVEWRDLDREVRDKFLKKAKDFMEKIGQHRLEGYFVPLLIKEIEDMEKHNSDLIKSYKLKGDASKAIAKENIAKNTARIKLLEQWDSFFDNSQTQEFAKQWGNVLKTVGLEDILKKGKDE